MNGELDFTQSLLRRVGLLKGLDAKVLGEIAARLPITPGAERLIRTLRSLDYRPRSCRAASPSRRGAASATRDRLHVRNELEVEGGRLTGRVRGEIVDGARKAALLRQLALQEGSATRADDRRRRRGQRSPDARRRGSRDRVPRQAAGAGLGRAGDLESRLDGILYLIGMSDREVQQA